MKFPDVADPSPPWCHLAVGPAGEAFDRLTALERADKRAVARMVRGGQATTSAELHAEFAAALQFPPGHGANWDALRDALLDLGWLGATQVTLLVTDAGDFLDRAPAKQCATFALLMAEALKHWNQPAGKRKPVPFHLVLQAEAKAADAVAARWAAAGLPLAKLS